LLVALATQRIGLQFVAAQPFACPCSTARRRPAQGRRTLERGAGALLRLAARLRDALLMAFLAALLCVTPVVAFAALYMAKRAAGIDAVPGVDMLPDELIEGTIHAVLSALFHV
jgi:hypothetical protein